MIQCLEKYQIKEEDVIDLSNNPSTKATGDALDALSKDLREGKKSDPAVNYLIVFIFAGHGIIKEGQQVLLYNEFDPETGFYKLFRAEQKMRGWALIYPNLFVIGIFACCR